MSVSRVAVRTGGRHLAAVLLASVLLAALLDRVVAEVIALPRPSSTYRRIGPRDGPQVFCAGSSLLQFALSWRDVSAEIGQGIENWGVGGSSPDIWEMSQPLAANANMMIIGVSLFDMNEYRQADSRANFVPLSQTVLDLWSSQPGPGVSKRLLEQYGLALVRTVFPSAGSSDAVLVGLRRLGRRLLALSTAAEDDANALVVPKGPILEFGEYRDRITDWSAGRTLRRLSLLRSESGGRHGFVGPKQLALRRMLRRAGESGCSIVVVLPVAPAYLKEFATPRVVGEFEEALRQATDGAQRVDVLRLDRDPGLNADDVFADLVHLNSDGRARATQAFLAYLRDRRSMPAGGSCPDGSR